MLQAQIFIDKDDLKDSIPLYEYIMRLLINQHIRGATVYRGRLGYGQNQRLNRPNDLFSFDETPMVITFVDEADKVKKALTVLRQEVKNGFIITHQVEEWL